MQKNKCKMCNKEIPHYRIYCSNDCKFLDDDYNRQRGKSSIVNDKNRIIKCKLCEKEFKDVNNVSGALTRHLRDRHNFVLNEISDYFIEKEVIEKEKWKCSLCNWETLDIYNKSGAITIHINKKHNESIESFVNKYPEYIKLWKMHFIRLERQKFLDESENNKIQCKICGEYFKKLSNSHLEKHNILPKEYHEKYGTTFIKKKNEKINKKRNVKCHICNEYFESKGMDKHLKIHKISTKEYVKNYPEFRKKYLDYNKRAEENKIECLVCGKYLGSERLLTFHVRLEHNLLKENYVKEIFFKNEKQLCKCGCKNKVKIYKQFPYRVDFISGHNKAMLGKMHKQSARDKMSNRAINRLIKKKKFTNIEKEFYNFLILNKIKFQYQVKTDYGLVDFYLEDKDIFVEIDGSYWHPLIIEKLNFRQIASVISEKRKSKIKNLLRIRDNDLKNIKNENDIFIFGKHYSLPIINYRQIISEKQYFKKYIEFKGKEKLKNKVVIFLNFLRTFQIEFPIIETDENLNDVIDKISNYDLDRVCSNGVFRNNISNLGVSYLKSNFRSYWKSSYGNNLTPVEAWKDDNLMRKVITYRIGLNDSNEFFDFSLHQMVMGLAARRITVSFFKPVLAAAIYRYFLGDIKNPVVIDPCMGFGARMLGFKAIYPEGRYIGIEPNSETFDELIKLSENFSNIELYNCTLEEYEGNKECDLTFTSIPYYDKEKYSEVVDYDSFDDWDKKFISSLLTYKNLVVNVHEDLESLFEYREKFYISNNTSHFNKSNSQKFELLLQL